MSHKQSQKIKISEEQRKRMARATESFREMKKELTPFTKQRKVFRSTVKGEWCDALCPDFLS
jgi:hypothetical protein